MGLEIPADKAATIERAREMEAGGWKALEGMTDAELSEWGAELEGAYVPQTGSHGSKKYSDWIHPHNKTRLDAMGAVSSERSRRHSERLARERAELLRSEYIINAARAASEAVEMLDRASSIDAEWPSTVPDPPALDVASASDAELARVADTCRGMERFREPAEGFAEWAASIGVIKGGAARSISAEMAGLAGRYAEAMDAARKLLAAIQEEQGRREHERRQAAEQRTPEAMEARIADLEKRLQERDGGGK